MVQAWGGHARMGVRGCLVRSWAFAGERPEDDKLGTADAIEAWTWWARSGLVMGQKRKRPNGPWAWA